MKATLLPHNRMTSKSQLRDRLLGRKLSGVRVDYPTNPVVTCKEFNENIVLSSENRTNFVVNSCNYAKSAWITNKSGTAQLPILTHNYAISPDGELNATRVQMDAGAGTSVSDYATVFQALPNLPYGTYCSDRWVKTNDGSTISLLFYPITGIPILGTVTGEWRRFPRVSNYSGETIYFRTVRIVGSTGSRTADILIWNSQLVYGEVTGRDIITNDIPTPQKDYTYDYKIGIVSLLRKSYNLKINGFDSTSPDNIHYQAPAIITPVQEV